MEFRNLYEVIIDKQSKCETDRTLQSEFKWSKLH